MTSLVLGAILLLTNGQSINFFSLKQDVEIGSESEKEARPSLPPLVANLIIKRYVTTIGERIVQNRTLPPLRYRFEIVNSKDINSLGFPGGAIYIYRGLLEIASSDDELAAIVAHEVSHVASRHGTAQLSRQLLVQAPTAIAAGLPVADVWKEQITRLGISLGIDAPFLRYSRDQELEAGLMAVRLMADARYDPNALRTLLEKIDEAQSSQTARAPAFVFNHPQAQTVSRDIAEEIERLSTPARHARTSLDFRNFRATLQRVAYQPAKSGAITSADAPTEALPNIFPHPLDYYRLAYPLGWQVTRTPPDGAIIAPPDGVQSSPGGNDLTHGVMFDLFNIAVPDRSLTLEQATNRLLVFLRQRNQNPNEATSWLRIVPGAQTQILVSDEPALRTVMIGKTDASGRPEVAWVVTRLYYQSLFYMVLVAPEDEFTTFQPVFEQMIGSIRLR
jgi:Zn-dependent protease with chaperone function